MTVCLEMSENKDTAVLFNPHNKADLNWQGLENVVSKHKAEQDRAFPNPLFSLHEHVKPFLTLKQEHFCSGVKICIQYTQFLHFPQNIPLIALLTHIVWSRAGGARVRDDGILFIETRSAFLFNRDSSFQWV